MPKSLGIYFLWSFNTAVSLARRLSRRNLLRHSGNHIGSTWQRFLPQAILLNGFCVLLYEYSLHCGASYRYQWLVTLIILLLNLTLFLLQHFCHLGFFEAIIIFFLLPDLLSAILFFCSRGIPVMIKPVSQVLYGVTGPNLRHLCQCLAQAVSKAPLQVVRFHPCGPRGRGLFFPELL